MNLSDDVVDKITDLTCFEKMKDDKAANMSWSPVFCKDGKPTFMRMGVVGDWKNFLSDEQSAEMHAICATRLKGTDIKFQYE